MLSSVEFFKDEALQGVSRSIKQLHQMQAEADFQKMDKFGITNHNQHFKNLLHYIDAIFSLGLVDPKKGYWSLVKKFCHTTTVQMVQSHHDATDQIKRGQIWLFLTFMESSLQSYIKLIRSDDKALRSFYKKFALLRDTERCSIFEQLIVGLEMVVFVLDFNTPLASFAREPLFSPTGLRASKNADIPLQFAEKVSSGTQTPPDVTIVDGGGNGREEHLKPDLLRMSRDGADRPSDQKLFGSDHDLVKHLPSKKRNDRSRRKPKKRVEPDDSTSITNELEEDNYIPEFQDSVPVTVVVPDETLNTSELSDKSNINLADEHVYEDFLFGMGCLNEIEKQLPNPDDGLRVGQETSISSTDGLKGGPGKSLPGAGNARQEHSRYDQKEHAVGLASSVNSDGAYRITYVTDDDDDDDDEGYVGHARRQNRTRSLDSFDKFCRSGSMSTEDRKKRQRQGARDDDDADDVDDDYDDNGFVRRELDAVSPAAEVIEDCVVPRTGSLDLSVDSEAITSSPISEILPKESIDRVLSARFDTSSGILLPSLPRRPTFPDACEVFHDISVDKNKIVLLSLEIFEQSNEVLKKMFSAYVGYLYGIRKKVFLAITNFNVFVLSATTKAESGYLKELCIPMDSINRIQSGMSLQDVLITHDSGQLNLWTGEEVVTKSICLALSSCLRTDEARTVSIEQMKVEPNNELKFFIKDWIMSVEKMERPEIFHFALVEFYPLNPIESEKKVVKSGHLHRKFSFFGMVPYWEVSIFGLRQNSLYEYSSKGSHELKQVFDLSKKCGGCVRIKSSDKLHGFRILNSDGATTLLELAADTEEEANDWIVNICQVMADSKHFADSDIVQFTETVLPRCLLLSSNKIYIFIKNSRNSRISLIDSCMVQDVLRICVDNQDRSYCVLQIDDSIGNYVDAQKRNWVLQFQSEFELGKFEQKIFAAWHSLYQVPLQFVLLADNGFKKSVQRYLSNGNEDTMPSVDDAGKTVIELASM